MRRNRARRRANLQRGREQIRTGLAMAVVAGRINKDQANAFYGHLKTVNNWGQLAAFRHRVDDWIGVSCTTLEPTHEFQTATDLVAP